MKVSRYGVAAAVIAEAIAQEFTSPLNDTPALDGKSLSLRGRSLLERQSYDYCGLSSYYCIGSECCGISGIYNCMAPGGECCASLSTYGYGLWCSAGSSCIIQSGLVQCKDGSGGFASIVSSAVSKVASTTSRDSTTAPTTDYTYPLTYSSYSPRSSSVVDDIDAVGSTYKKSKSKAWIAGAVIGPLIGIAAIAGVVFFLFVFRKKSRTDANNYANSAINNHQGGAQPPMAPAPGPLSPNPDHKTPAYTQQYEIPTPIASPPPQWTPASPPVSPAPVYAHHQFTNELHGQSVANPVSPMNTGDGAYGSTTQQHQQPQQVYGDAGELPTGTAAHASGSGTAELPTAPAAQPARGGAQELHG